MGGNRRRVGLLAVAVVVAIPTAVVWLNTRFNIWPRLSGPDDDNPILRLIDRGDKISGILSLAFAALSVWLTIPRPSAEQRGPNAPRRQREQVGHIADRFLDRKRDRKHLRRALSSRDVSIIAVTGAAGVGKTELVRQAVGPLDPSTGRWWDVTPSARPTGEMILQDIRLAGDWPPDSSPTGEEWFSTRLQVALDHLGRKRAVIVIDALEHLLNEDKELLDPSLDQALETVFNERRPNITFVIVGRDVPKSLPDGSWTPGKVVRVEGLPWRCFAALARTCSEKLSSMPDEDLASLCRDLHGRPRLVELLGAAVDNEPDASARELVRAVHTWAEQRSDPVFIRDQLLDRLFNTPADSQAQILEAVAAFAVPVNAQEVATLLAEESGSLRFQGILLEFVDEELTKLSRHVLRKAGNDAFYLPPDEARHALRWRDDDDSQRVSRIRRLLAAAADRLRHRRLQGCSVTHADYLAEVDAWVRADLPLRAVRSIDEIDETAGNGSPLSIFQQHREAIAEWVERGQIRNYMALGYIYHHNGQLGAALRIYERVLKFPGVSDTTKAKAQINMAWVYWSKGSVEIAHMYFERALNLAPEGSMVAVGAEDGLARYLRRAGEFNRAIDGMVRALNAAPPGTERHLLTAVRLARLQVECGRLDEAGAILHDVADPATEPRSAIYLDALADLRFAQQQFSEAFRLADQAQALALGTGDTIRLMQARSTMCLIQLHHQQWRRALRDAILAERYQGPESSLLVLALKGVAYRRLEQRIEARAVFEELHSAAQKRTDDYDYDFVAWEFSGLAQCGLMLDESATTTACAERAFRRAQREPRQPSPGLTEMMAFLTETLAVDETERDRLRPAAKVLRRALTLPAAG